MQRTREPEECKVARPREGDVTQRTSGCATGCRGRGMLRILTQLGLEVNGEACHAGECRARVPALDELPAITTLTAARVG
jgi:hypothetical protein